MPRILLILLFAIPASAEMRYGNRVRKTGDTMTGNLTAPAFIGTLNGNADTASGLGTNPDNCPKGGQAMSGIDEFGNAEGCFEPGETNTYVSSKTFTGGVKITGGVIASTGVFTSTLTVQGADFSVGGPSIYSVNSGSVTASGSVIAGSGFRANGFISNDYLSGAVESSLIIRPDLDLSTNDFPIFLIGNDDSNLGTGFPMQWFWNSARHVIEIDNNNGYAIGLDVSGNFEANEFTVQNGVNIGQRFLPGFELEIAESTMTVHWGRVAIGTDVIKGSNTNLFVYGIVTSSTPIPSISCSAGTGSMAADSNNQSGSFTAGAAAANCTVTFNTSKAWPKKPRCFCNNETSNDFTRAVTTLTTLVCHSSDGNFGGETISYGCQGAP